MHDPKGFSSKQMQFHNVRQLIETSSKKVGLLQCSLDGTFIFPGLSGRYTLSTSNQRCYNACIFLFGQNIHLRQLPYYTSTSLFSQLALTFTTTFLPSSQSHLDFPYVTQPSFRCLPNCSKDQLQCLQQNNHCHVIYACLFETTNYKQQPIDLSTLIHSLPDNQLGRLSRRLQNATL